jgi:hypothetical protein
MIKIGTPVVYRGKNCVIKNGPYTARFITSADRDLIDHGMGHLAGSYASAYDLFDVDNGVMIMKVSPRSIKLL